jgi:heme exporter protein A
MNTGALLEARDLGCIRGEQRLFSSISLRLEAGQGLQIHGPNGSGKTTLLRILCALTPGTEGGVYWCGRDILEHRGNFLQHLAYVGHHHGIKDDLSALENLRIARSLGRPRPGACLYNALEQVGLDGLGEEPARHFSAGQRRRLALARLLVTEAQLWILDEPFTALDQDAIRNTEQLLARHLEQGGMTVLTSHQPLQQLGERMSDLRLAA